VSVSHSGRLRIGASHPFPEFGDRSPVPKRVPDHPSLRTGGNGMVKGTAYAVPLTVYFTGHSPCGPIGDGIGRRRTPAAFR
jgi:hypothetical protein